MKLYFLDSDVKTVIAAPRTREEVIEIIHAFCDEINFRVYYIRTYRNEDGLEVYDFGSRYKFFLLDDKN